METKPLYSKTITCFLSTCWVEVFKLTVMSRPLKIGHDHILEITGLVVSTTGMAPVESFQDTIKPNFLVVSISRNKQFNIALLWGAKVSGLATRDGTRWWGSSNPFCCTSVFQAFFLHTNALDVENWSVWTASACLCVQFPKGPAYKKGFLVFAEVSLDKRVWPAQCIQLNLGKVSVLFNKLSHDGQQNKANTALLFVRWKIW